MMMVVLTEGDEQEKEERNVTLQKTLYIGVIVLLPLRRPRSHTEVQFLIHLQP